MNNNNTTNLLQVLRVRQTRAQLALNEQKKQVQQAETAHLNALAAVAGLNALAIENSEYRSRDSVQSDPHRICEAIAHRKRIDYELERESYYEAMARDELQHQLGVLKQKQQALEKIHIKLDKVTELQKSLLIRQDFLQQDSLEEETAAQINYGVMR